MREFAVLVLFLCVLYGKSEEVTDSPILVQVLYRHGDRTPAKTFPNDPYQEDTWPQGFGQLIQKGMKRHYELGQYLRKRYIEGSEYQLLNDSYKRDEFQVYSTNMDRTLMSAYSNLAGLYPPAGRQLWDEQIKWQPIPVHTRLIDDDYMLEGLSTRCPEASRLIDEALNSPEMKEKEKKNSDFYNFVSNRTGVPVVNVTNLWWIKDALLCEADYDLDIPSWVNDTWGNETIFEKMSEISTMWFNIKFSSEKLCRLIGGPQLKVMINNFRGKINGWKAVAKRKFIMYSAHDTTVAAVSAALGVYNNKMPPYAAALVLELFNNTGKPAVRILYKNVTDTDIYNLTIPGCSEFCPWDQFLSLTKHNIPDHIDKECQIPSTSLSTEKIIIISCVCGGLVLLIIAVMATIACRRRRSYLSYERHEGIQENA